MKKVECSRCTFCNLQCETISHLFYECVLLKTIWHHIAESFSKMCGFDVTFSCKDIILEYVNEHISVYQTLHIQM